MNRYSYNTGEHNKNQLRLCCKRANERNATRWMIEKWSSAILLPPYVYIETAEKEREGGSIVQRKCNEIVNSPHPFPFDSNWLHCVLCSFGVINFSIFPNTHPQKLNHKIVFIVNKRNTENSTQRSAIVAYRSFTAVCVYGVCVWLTMQGNIYFN